MEFRCLLLRKRILYSTYILDYDIVSRDNCIINSRGDGLAFFKQFISDGQGGYQIQGYSHVGAVSDYGIDGSGDSFPVNLDPAAYFNDPDSGDFSRVPGSSCMQLDAGLMDSARIQLLFNNYGAH